MSGSVGMSGCLLGFVGLSGGRKEGRDRSGTLGLRLRVLRARSLLPQERGLVLKVVLAEERCSGRAIRGLCISLGKVLSSVGELWKDALVSLAIFRVLDRFSVGGSGIADGAIVW